MILHVSTKNKSSHTRNTYLQPRKKIIVRQSSFIAPTLNMSPYLGYQIPDYAALVPRISGSISAVSSSLIIYLIFRSKAKLTTIYHRIMFGMSVADVMASTAMALTTLPMPTNDDPIWVGQPIFWEEQTKLGNVQTCAVQGFAFYSGINIMFAYNGSLCGYYACAIAFRLQEEQIRKRIEPWIHGVPLIIGLAPAISISMHRMYMVTMNESWCTVGNNSGIHFQTQILSMAFIIIPCTLIWFVLISLILVIRRVWKNGRILDQANSHGDIHIVEEERIEEAHHNTKLIIAQSLGYFGAFLLTLTFPSVRNIYQGSLSYASITNLNRLYLVFTPLQGFFNFIIFLWHKGKMIKVFTLFCLSMVL